MKMIPNIMIIYALFFASCFGSDCKSRGLGLQYTGYDSTELSLAIINKYEPGSNFSKLVAADSYRILYSPKYLILEEQYDWAVSLPHAGHTDYVKDIRHIDNKNRGVLPSGGGSYDCCYDGLTCVFNGKEINFGKLTEAECNGRTEWLTVNK